LISSFVDSTDESLSHESNSWLSNNIEGQDPMPLTTAMASSIHEDIKIDENVKDPLFLPKPLGVDLESEEIKI